MPIEDIDYLKKNSRKESYTFLVDSASRDKEHYPTPSSYVVNFSTPFQYVVGLEVIDASIPRTQYNIDITNNTLTFMINDLTLNNTPYSCNLHRFKTVAIEPGDYSIQTLIPQLNSILTDYVQTSNVVIDRTVPSNNSNLYIGSITASPVSNPPDIKNLIKFTCPYPFVFDMLNSTAAETLGFDMFTQSNESLKTPLQQRYVRYDNLWSSNLLPPDNTQNRQLYHSVDLPPSVSLGVQSLVFNGPRGVINKVPIVAGSVVTQSFTVTTAKVYLSAISVAFSGLGTVAWAIYKDIGGQPGGSNRLVAQGTIEIYQSDGTLSPSEDVPTNPPALLPSGKYWISFTPTASTSPDAALLYNDVPVPTEILMNSTPTGWNIVKLGDLNATGSIQITTADEYHTLISPGTYNLIGERYIILRCPEIEENAFRSLAYSSQFLGLAMFRLGINGISDNPVSHVKVPTREFHPIGKLSRMSLSFQTVNGKTYDFKGVNHTITFALYYLEPHSQVSFTQSIINPNYTGDFMKYLLDQEDKEGDSDDQDESYDRDVLMNYRVQEARHLPETVQNLDREALFRARIEEHDV
jgi:hypothetical protein